jgi:multidrug efflux system membrane fusion protein
VDTHRLIVTGQVAQQHVSQLRVGGRGTALLVTGQTVEGSIHYIAATAHEATRTFTVELAIPNPDGALVAGVSSEMRLPVETLHAHLVSPALLSLDDAGSLGVKSVSDHGVVIFHTAHMVRTNAQGVWLADLPTTLRLITVGQGFVRPGDRVHAVPEAAAGAHAVREPPADRQPAASRTSGRPSARHAS